VLVRWNLQFLSRSLQPKKEVTAAAPIMHPIFGAAEPQQQQYPNDQMYQQQQQFGAQPFSPLQNQVPPPMNNAAPTGFYQPQQQAPMQQQQQQVNYQNFQNFPGQQQQPQQTMSPPPPVQSPPKQKMPLPEEFIYMQTVLEELKTQCIAAAGNPVALRLCR
jgi:protein transport protein SEC31